MSAPSLMFSLDSLIACYWTLAGARHSTPPRFTFEERVAAAARAGFRNIGLRHDDYRTCRERGLSDADLRAVLSEHGVAVPELEFVSGWSSDDASVRARARDDEETLYRAAAAFGSRHINCGCSEPLGALPAMEAVVERFAALCDRAASRGLKVALEFMPWTGIPDIPTAWEVVSRAGRPNGGLLLDSWHYFRGSPDAQALRNVPPGQIVAIQIDDAAEEQTGDMREDTLRRRLLPGEGAFDLAGLLRVLEEMGVDAPLGIEIIADSNAELPLDVLARRAFDSMEALLASASGQRA